MATTNAGVHELLPHADGLKEENSLDVHICMQGERVLNQGKEFASKTDQTQFGKEFTNFWKECGAYVDARDLWICDLFGPIKNIRCRDFLPLARKEKIVNRINRPCKIRDVLCLRGCGWGPPYKQITYEEMVHLFLKGSSLSPYVSFRSNRQSYLLRCKSQIPLRFRRVHILFESEIGSCPYFCKSRRGLLIAMVRQCKGGGYILIINTMCF